MAKMFQRLGGALLMVACLLLIGTPSLAGEVVCSICGKAFPEGTEKCPNDGTDLRKLGIEISEDTSGDAKPSKQKKEEEEIEEPDTEDESEILPADSDQTQTPIYKRGGRRRMKSGKASYSDRRSRVSIRRGRAASHEDDDDEELRKFMEEDERLLAKYEIQRRQSEALRQRMELVEKEASKNRSAERKRLLYGLAAPLTSLGYRMFWMGEENDPGPVNTVEIDLNLARYRFRAGLSTLIGVRTLSGRNELVFLEHVALGFQYPWRYSPYIIARGGVGVLANERFGVSFVNLITSLGAEIGIDSWVTPWIAITTSVGYVRTMMNNAYWNSFTFKVALGF